jgi:tRNA threonylcarbamoyladenosine dehydratase
MDKHLDRIELLIGVDNTEIIKQSSVMIVGCGGVGAMAAEALVRFGVGKLFLVDHDISAPSNINRQIHATVESIGLKKVKALSQRLLAINPDCDIIKIEEFINNDNIKSIFERKFNCMVDAIDTVTSKCLLYEHAQKNNIPIISSMGMGNRLDPTLIRVMPLNKTINDPLARVMRYQCRKRGLDDKMKVVCSIELPKKQTKKINESSILKESMPPSSSSFVPMAAGLACGHEVVKILLNKEEA